MKKIFVFIIYILPFQYVIAQNSRPRIPVYGTEVIAGNSTVRIVYDLYDEEDDDIKISLKISNNSGKTYSFNIDEPTGDIGYPVKSGTEKEIIWNYPDTVSFDDIISGRFIIKLTADDMKEFDIHEIIDLVDSTKLKNDLLFIQGIRHYNPPHNVHLEEVKDMIEERFSNLNFLIEKDQFTYDTYLAENIAGKLPGNYDEEIYYIIGGHFDSVEWGPGADDNGSAVAGFLEAARVLSMFNFEKSIRFVGFDLEEQRITGSNHYVNNALPPNEQLLGVFNFEMIGYYSNLPNTQEMPAGFETAFPDFYQSVVQDDYRGNFIFNVANTESNGIKTSFDTCAAKYVPDLRVLSLEVPGDGSTVPDLRRSDHSRFWDAGYHALMLTDGANYRNMYYHTENDLAMYLNFVFMERVVKATVATVAALAKPIHGEVRPFVIKEYSVYNQEVKINDNANGFEISPNPSNHIASVKYNVPENGTVIIELYNYTGSLVKRLLDEVHPKGSYEKEILVNDLNPGLYICTFRFAGKIYGSQKLLIVN